MCVILLFPWLLKKLSQLPNLELGSLLCRFYGSVRYGLKIYNGVYKTYIDCSFIRRMLENYCTLGKIQRPRWIVGQGWISPPGQSFFHHSPHEQSIFPHSHTLFLNAMVTVVVYFFSSDLLSVDKFVSGAMQRQCASSQLNAAFYSLLPIWQSTNVTSLSFFGFLGVQVGKPLCRFVFFQFLVV